MQGPPQPSCNLRDSMKHLEVAGAEAVQPLSRQESVLESFGNEKTLVG